MELNPLRRLQIFLNTIKFEHSIFALPFAVAAAFMVAGGWPNWVQFGWVIVAMVTLRTFAMAANRLVDAEIDRRNPRTADRALARGIIGKPEVIGYMAVSAIVFVVAAWQLDPLSVDSLTDTDRRRVYVPVFEAIHLVGAFRHRCRLRHRSARGRDRYDGDDASGIRVARDRGIVLGIGLRRVVRHRRYQLRPCERAPLDTRALRD